MAWLCGCINSITSICSWKPALLPVTAAFKSPHWDQKVKNSPWQLTQTVNKASCCSACLRICLGFLIFFFFFTVFLKRQHKGNRRKGQARFLHNVAANTNVTGKPHTQLGAAVSAPAAVRINQTGVREAAAHPFTPARTGIPHTATTQAATAATGRVHLS